MPAAHFGVTIPQIKRTWDESKSAARDYEAMGYDSLWVCDHLYGPQSPSVPILEAWSLLGAVAAVTERVELGTLVTPAGMRNAAQLAKVIATVDNIAGGRVIAGFGAGWMPREFTDFDTPFLAPRDRLRQLEETVRLAKRMWSEDEPVTFEGQHVHAENVVCLPKPPRSVPVLIGGGGEKVALRIVAEQADIWNNRAGDQAVLGTKLDVLRGHCEAVGRDFNEITISQQCLVTIAPDEESAGPMVESAQKIFGGHLGDPAGPMAISGSPATVRARIQQHIDLGCTMFQVEFFGRDPREPARLFAETVMPHFR